MSDLISRSALLENIAHLGKTEDLTTELKPGAKAIFNAISWHIEQAFAVDAVEVVRCRECKFAEQYENTAGAVYCKHPKYRFIYGQTWNREFNPVCDAAHFCSYGERKDND